ncbi:hypothetical protein RUMTOR_01003 [[Ruminococcus] torques ATCC 27756]|jgi:hypothetical protein|uniref:Uncharacterized protein n=2 Tax=[Ruminococcus] torques TaxID=33039 RepID=A5KL98_9FIRM|nr:hypothetical protein RUMTOR_01003 [[Ruminococcus] torques ATCC 27756]
MQQIINAHKTPAITVLAFLIFDPLSKISSIINISKSCKKYYLISLFPQDRFQHITALTKNNYPIKASQILLIFTCFIDFYQSVEYIKQGRINGKINKEVTNEVSYLL